MTSKEVLIKFLNSADGKDIRKYAELLPSYGLDDITLYIDDVQKDTSSASSMRLRISFSKAGFPDDTHDTETKRTALRDLIARRFWESCRTFAKGGDRGGAMNIPRPGQEITDRSSVVMSETFIEVRFKALLPFAGKNVAGSSAIKMLVDDLTEISNASLFFGSYKRSKLYDHLNTLATSRKIRSSLREKGLVAFIADNSILPRREDGLAPMIGAVPFRSPDTLRVSFDTADGKTIEGMGIPEGITAMIGSPSSGKSTIIDAVASGVHDHIPGDGRELVITADDASLVSRDVGRTARNADVSSFLSGAPYSNGSFSTDNASDSESSALSATEALETGSRLLIMNDMNVNHGLLYRDAEISKMLPDGGNMIPVTEILKGTDVSAIIECRHHQVADAADTVIIMSGHVATDAVKRKREHSASVRMPIARMPMSRNMDVKKGRKDVNAVALSSSKVEIGESIIKLPHPFSDVCQAAAAADSIIFVKEMMDGTLTMKELTERAEKEFRIKINSTDVNIGPERTAFRANDAANIINRHPDVIIAQKR
ncbi:MAG: ABC-ATPase domain-containing protein [Methanomassiliicoccaceae archaeon]|nr:ABC-ATPase domain-containing protein [Methanomassiliicoccaceae archaeon]